jgi:hypothetical protein
VNVELRGEASSPDLKLTQMKAAPRRTVNFAFWFQGLFLSAMISANAADFEVSGSLTIQSINRNRTVKQHFDVVVSGCRALILSSNIDASGHYLTINPNGGFIRHTNTMDRECIQVGIGNGTQYKLSRFYSKDGCKTAAEVSAAERPDDDGSGILYLWYAYVSSCYFSQQTNDFLEPIWPLDDSNLKTEHFKEKADWILNDQEPFLPHKVTYFSDGKLRGRVNGISHTNAAPAPYDQGFTNFTYEELSSSNQAGAEVPAEFRFIRYEFLGTATPEPITVTTGQIDKFTFGTSVSTFAPPFAGDINVFDKRYQSSNPPIQDLIYPAHNGNWIGTNEDQIYRQELRSRHRSAENQASNAMVGAVTIVFILFGSAVFATLLKQKTQKG